MPLDSYYDPPDDEQPLSPLAEELAEKLERAGVNEDLMDEILAVIADLTDKLSRTCPECERRAMAAEREAEEKAAAYWVERELPKTESCLHGEAPYACNACLVASDLAYDAARERRFR